MYGYLNSQTCSGNPSSVTDYSTCNDNKLMFGAGEDVVDTTRVPTKNPTVIPTKNPTVIPTKNPTVIPTKNPTVIPTKNPTVIPTMSPTFLPTFIPTFLPTEHPSVIPTVIATMAPTAEEVHLVGDVTLSNIDYSLLSTKDISDLANGAESSLQQLLNIDSSYIEVSVNRGSRRRLTARINPATTPSDTVVIHFTINAVSTYLTSHLGISSTSTPAVISDQIENHIASGGGSSFKNYLQTYVNSYGTTDLKTAVSNSNYQSASVAEQSSNDSESDSVKSSPTLVIAVVVGVVGGIAVVSGLAAVIYFFVVRKNVAKLDYLPGSNNPSPDNKMEISAIGPMEQEGAICNPNELHA
jgi:hypothetical protein